MQSPRPIAIANWLLTIAALVFAMVVVGGITRLTESGLSITEWKPVSGALPPLSDADWQAAFAKYRETPEYRQINSGMSIAEFKFIFFWEWLHRLLGRLVGLAFALPLAWFWVKKAIPAGYKPRLLALLALGGLQGAIGWWMVVSGLSERTDVSHFRLAVHLLIALFILAGLVWTALDLRRQPARLTGFALAVALTLFVQLLLGAWTAGLNAGLVANDWPLMNGQFYPGPTQAGRPFLEALAYDPAIIHFLHRWWAWIVVGLLVVLARRVKRAGNRAAAIAIHSAFGLQILLGIATVMTGVNIGFGILHQAVGAILVAGTAWGAHIIGRGSHRPAL